MKNRLNNYDLLRIIAAIAVISIHASARYVNPHDIIVLIYYILSRFAVPCFLMLTGALVLSNDKNKEYKYFYTKSFKYIGIPTIIFSIFYFCVSMINRILLFIQGNTELNNFYIPINNLLTGSPHFHMWYLYMLIGIYIFIPIVIRFKNSISEKSFKYISYIFMMLCCVFGLTSNHLLNYDLSLSFIYLSYVMIGYQISKENDINNKKAFIFIIFGLAIESLIIVLQYYQISFLKLDIINNFNPLIALGSIMIFKGFTHLKVNTDLSKLSKMTFNIYLIHAFVLETLFLILNKYALIYYNNSTVIIPSLIIIVFIISYILSIIYDKFYKKALIFFQNIYRTKKN